MVAAPYDLLHFRSLARRSARPIGPSLRFPFGVVAQAKMRAITLKITIAAGSPPPSLELLQRPRPCPQAGVVRLALNNPHHDLLL
jgi:hypothetical protein